MYWILGNILSTHSSIDSWPRLSWCDLIFWSCNAKVYNDCSFRKHAFDIDYWWNILVTFRISQSSLVHQHFGSYWRKLPIKCVLCSSDHKWYSSIWYLSRWNYSWYSFRVQANQFPQHKLWGIWHIRHEFHLKLRITDAHFNVHDCSKHHFLHS